MITRAKVQNFKGLRALDISLNPKLNILVGDNEMGKSTLLEAINLALTGQLNGRSVAHELHPFLFHQAATAEYVTNIRSGKPAPPPQIVIEVYLSDEKTYADLKGRNNSRNEDCPGIKFVLSLDDAFSAEYAAWLTEPSRITMVPVEYYRADWYGFSGNIVDLRTLPIKPILIDPGAITNSYAASRYVVEVARDFLTPPEQAGLALAFRSTRDDFSATPSVKAINAKLESEKGNITERKLSVALDMTARTSWETSVQPHLDDLPLSQIGKGEQNAIKLKLALRAAQDRHILLVEEPENHLSHTNLARLIADIEQKANGRQLIITTHSSFVLNKLGISNTLMFTKDAVITLDDLDPDTSDYFAKLPGHDTLRMVLARRSILVEGPSDELIVQRAYKDKHGKLPLADGVEVIAVGSLAFKRFLDIAVKLNLSVAVVTDNDGKPDLVETKYAAYNSHPTISICYSVDSRLQTLEPHLLAQNGRDALNLCFDRSDAGDDTVLAWMSKNKTDCALRLFKTSHPVKMPDYILNAIA
jgi:putative ATP-dependent endonuclease of the OLD family